MWTDRGIAGTDCLTLLFAFESAAANVDLSYGEHSVLLQQKHCLREAELWAPVLFLHVSPPPPF